MHASNEGVCTYSGRLKLRRTGSSFDNGPRGGFVRGELRMFGDRLLPSCTGVSSHICRLSGRKQIDGLDHLLCGEMASATRILSSKQLSSFLPVSEARLL